MISRLFLFAAKNPYSTLLFAAGCLFLGVFVFVASGVLTITASSGHWPITEWFLHFAMRRSVITHAALLVDQPPPDLDSPAMVLRGAGHFEAGCRPCHGAPGDPPPPIPYAMTPHPPALSPRVPTWNAKQLFYIVKHGVKFTGMPAWPSLPRNDEVWAVVGFLRQLPAMDKAGYDALVRGGDSSLMEMFAGTNASPAPPPIVQEMCARCHGMDGLGRGEGAFPTLAGQRYEYMRLAFDAYEDRRRHSGIMEPLVSGMPDEMQHDALQYYASLPARAAPPVSGEDTEMVSRGAAIAMNGVPEDEIPSCLSCHTEEPVNEAYPRLRGQYRGYLATQLRLLKERRRGGSEYVQIMHTFVDRLSDEQIEAVAAYFSAASPARQ